MSQDLNFATPLEMLYRWEEKSPERLFLRQPIDGEYHDLTWKEAMSEIRKMAAVLKGYGFPQGAKIAILSKNCNYWLLSDLAIMMAGYVSVPLYPNSTAKTVNQILEHSETSLIFVGKLDDADKMKAGIPKHVKCISFPIYSHPEYANWADLTAKAEPLPGKPNRELDDLMTIIYTSGTTGIPKGVMHPFRTLAFAASNAIKVFDKLEEGGKFFSYLPLSHIAERMVVEFASVYTGGQVWFAESLDLFAKNLQDAQPHVFLGVPRIWTKFQMAILEKIPQKKLNLLLAIPILSTLFKKTIKKKLGLSQAKYTITGAAPMPVATLEWFKKMGIEIQEGYAMSENAAYSHFTLQKELRFGTVGKALPFNEVRISEEGEIQARCPSIMTGYYKEPGLTAETITPDGFLRTGDTGFIDKEGFLTINGRLKDIFKSSKGKYISPNPIELELSENQLIEQVCVAGDNIPQPIAMVCLSAAAKELGRGEVEAALAQTLSQTNLRFDPHEHLATIVIMPEDWTIESGVLTPTMKIKRNFLDDKYRPKYEEWYAAKGSVIWV